MRKSQEDWDRELDREELLRDRRLERERQLREQSEEDAGETASRSRITRFILPPVVRYYDAT